MSSRTSLQSLLETALGSSNVYFQPPTSVRMAYPAIVYSLERPDVLHADNIKYRNYKCYRLTYIHKNPDDPIYDTIEDLPLCSFDRRYVSENLYHDVFTIYYLKEDNTNV